MNALDGQLSELAGIVRVSVVPQPEQLRGFDLIVIGNGMGRGSSTRAAVQLVLDSGVPCILDGDALYEAGMHGLLPTHRDSALIVTPHMRVLEYRFRRSAAIRVNARSRWHSAILICASRPKMTSPGSCRNRVRR